MSLQLILGASGSGKSYFAYKKIIEESIKNPKTNYILLVPEQYSLALQRKMVMLHPNGGTMNIDVIGFNRLAYRVFDELGIKPKKVLQDFGKSMLIRQVAGKLQSELSVFSGCLDKSGFIDEIKSLMSEMFQYDIRREQLYEVLDKVDNDSLLFEKLSDMEKIFSAFEDKISEEYVVAEQITDMLALYIDKSNLIKNSVIVMDGFTGFTPVQNKIIERLMVNSKKVYTIFTIDKKYYYKKSVSEHELFYLSKQSINSIKNLAGKNNVPVESDILLGFDEEALRWGEEAKDLWHLENNLFRYPYDKYDEEPENIKLFSFDTPRNEIEGIAYNIRELVRSGKYRYKDIAVVTGNLERAGDLVEQIFPIFDIPFFVDTNQPIKNNPFIDSIEQAINIVKDNFSYDSVFAFIKAGVINEFSYDEIETLENYAIARDIHGISNWKKKWREEIEDIRVYYGDILIPFYEAVKPRKGGLEIKAYVDAIRALMDRLGFEEQMEDDKVYNKLQEMLDKMLEIIDSEKVEIGEFSELLKIGLKDISLGMIPNSLDMVVVGDITRSRFDDIKILFIIDINDGVIPKKGNGSKLINDADKEKLAELGMELAPTERLNSYIQQFYLYINMTKPSDKLYLAYTHLDSSNEPARASYIVGRIKNIFPKLGVCNDFSIDVGTAASSVDLLINGLRELQNGNNENLERTIRLYKYYQDSGNESLLSTIESAFAYNNVPSNLRSDVTSLIELRLMSQSVSRLETFAKCAYMYFLQHTLGIKEREVFNIDNRNTGNVLHKTMEKLYRYVHDEKNNAWDVISDEDLDKITGDFVSQAFNEEYYGTDENGELEPELTGRYAYVKGMLERIGKRTAKALKKISLEDLLTPEYFEYNFKKEYKDEGKRLMNIRGIVDRGDVYYSKEENSLSLRVIDYKSGNHEFKISKLYDGLQLQLSLYMDIMLELVKALPENSKYDKIVPEGMYYYHMHDPFIEIKKKDDFAKLEDMRDKEFKLKGLKNVSSNSNDSEETGEDNDSYFDTVIKYAKYKAVDIAKAIVEGNISKNPLMDGSQSSCEYCAYKEVCRFDTKEGKNKFRYPKYKESDKEVIYSEMRKALGGAADELDEGTAENN